MDKVYVVEEGYPKLLKCPTCGTRFKKKEDGSYFCSGCLVTWTEEEYNLYLEDRVRPDEKQN